MWLFDNETRPLSLGKQVSVCDAITDVSLSVHLLQPVSAKYHTRVKVCVLKSRGVRTGKFSGRNECSRNTCVCCRILLLNMYTILIFPRTCSAIYKCRYSLSLVTVNAYEKETRTCVCTFSRFHLCYTNLMHSWVLDSGATASIASLNSCSMLQNSARTKC